MFLNALNKTVDKVIDNRSFAMQGKSYTPPTSLDTLFGGCTLGSQYGYSWLSAMASINYYSNIAPIAKSVNTVAKEFASIQPVLRNKKTNEYIREFELKTPASRVLKLLENPSDDVTGSEFKRESCSFEYITGNNFWVITSLTKDSEPINLEIAKPQDINISYASDGKPAQYNWNFADKNLMFVRENGGYRYFAQRNGLTYEIWHSRNFNPKSSTGNQWGLSPLNPIYMEIEQYMASNVHNLSLLNKGARPSGILLLEGMDDAQYERAKEQMRNCYQGADNAGNVLMFEGTGQKDFKQISISPKDMDFAELKKMVGDSIYNVLDIPLPFVSSENMTLNNYGEAKYILYDLNVLPFSDKLYEELTNFLLLRYKDGEKYELTYIEQEIPALQVRYNQEVERLIKTGVLTYDEARELLGYNPLNEGGNIIYQPLNLVPVGSTVETKSVRNYTKKDRFINIMEEKGFSSDEIKPYLDKFYKE